MIIFHRIVYHNNFPLSRKIFIYSPHTKNLSPFFVFSPPFRGTILKNTTKKQKRRLIWTKQIPTPRPTLATSIPKSPTKKQSKKPKRLPATFSTTEKTPPPQMLTTLRCLTARTRRCSLQSTALQTMKSDSVG